MNKATLLPTISLSSDILSNKEKFNEMQGFQVSPGELIMSCSGTMGKVAIVPENAPAGVINQALLKLTPTDRVLGVFLKLWMESDNFQKYLSDFTYGAAIKNVASVKILKGLRLPLHLSRRNKQSSPRSKPSRRWSPPTAN